MTENQSAGESDQRLPGSAALRRLVGEARALLSLGAPLVAAQLVQVGMAVTDILMAGRLGGLELAAVGLGASLWMPIMLGCTGLMMAVSPMVARARGAGQVDRIAAVLNSALWLALGLALLATPAAHEVNRLLAWVGVDPQVQDLAGRYVQTLAWAMPALCLYLPLRFLCEGLGDTRPIMFIQIVALLVNGVGNYALMFGHLGFPRLGAIGAAWSTVTVLWLDLALVMLYLHRSGRLRLSRRFDFKAQLELVKIGLPIAGATLLETGLFSAVALLMGRISTLAVAAHQVALNFAALTFMVPLGLSMAVTVRVGHSVGAGRLPEARARGFAGIVVTGMVMAFAAAAIWTFAADIARFYSIDPDVVNLATQLLMVAALFQVSDGIQVGALGALRGLHDTFRPMLITLVAYWLVGLPSAYWLAFRTTLGAVGLWMGLTLGLSVAAVLLVVRFRRISGHGVAR